jgi:hypothetical protein
MKYGVEWLYEILVLIECVQADLMFLLPAFFLVSFYSVYFGVGSAQSI